MGRFTHFHIEDGVSERDELRIDLSRRKAEAALSAFKFVDKDTKQFVIYIPAFEISGYGETIDKAKEMVKTSLDDFFDSIISLSPKNLQIELSKFGWNKNKFRNKEFSKAYVDINGELQGMNAEDNKVERITLVAE